jgi:hypothetical protein
MFDSDFNETEDEISDDDKEEATVRRYYSPPLYSLPSILLCKFYF